MAMLELYGTKGCPYTQELREWLEWKGTEFVEYDVEEDLAARDRMRSLADGQRTVPILVEGNKVIQVGWQGRGCLLAME
jgi:glutaredoxin